jgi:hypothetical protein
MPIKKVSTRPRRLIEACDMISGMENFRTSPKLASRVERSSSEVVEEVSVSVTASDFAGCVGGKEASTTDSTDVSGE